MLNRRWLRASWDWLTRVNDNDPLRQLQNRRMVPIALMLMVLAVFGARGYSDWPRIAALLGFACSIPPVLWLNRRGGASGAILLTSLLVLLLGIVLEPSWYLAPLDEPLYVPAEPLLPILFAAFFVSPRASLLVCALQIGVLVISGVLRNVDAGAIENLVVYGSITLWAIAALAYSGAAQLISALQRSLSINDELERRVAERTAELAIANARIESITNLRAKEVAEVVHDARNQLGNIRAAAELLADTERREVAIRSRTTIDTALETQQELLNALLEAALLDAGALALNRESSSLVMLADMVVSQIRPRFATSQCELIFDYAPGLPRVSCDQRRITRVIQNLLHNALSYTASFRPSGGQVCVTVLREGEEIVLRVADNGVGIARDKLAHIGQRFVRVAGAGMPQGSGIGLSAGMGIVALHGGQLRLLSAGEGCGTTAELRLPIAGAAGQRAS